MTVPAEYQRARDDFYAFLLDARDRSGLWSTHVTYTMVQGVFQVFRRRLTVHDSIAFANTLRACLRALYIVNWDTEQEPVPFADIATLNAEVRSLRADHNFSTENAIQVIAATLQNHVDQIAFKKMLKTLSPEAQLFWLNQEKPT